MIKYINRLFEQNNNWRFLFISLVFLASFSFFLLIFNKVVKRFEKRASKTTTSIDSFLIKLLKIPAIWIIFSTSLHIFSTYLADDAEFFNVLKKISQILLIASIGWLLVQGVRAISKYSQSKLNIADADNLDARRKMTQIRMFEAVIISIIIIVFVAIGLMTFETVKNLGKGILASAGVLGLIVGLAAQRSAGQILSGLQIAITQPIKIDDVVVIEGEWGRIEEINITYVLVKIWDERRLVVPIDYFLQKPIQNWTSTTSHIIGTVYLYVSYDLQLDPLRKKLESYVKTNPNWDGRVQNVQVTDSKEWYKEIRFLVSSADSSINWDLRVEVREVMIDFINENYPGSFAKIDMMNKSDEKLFPKDKDIKE
ncbi:MAG TPA: mechanosensitive ion channel domain-containing protein [Dysgonamonadaceae bacterium]|nr:mechanosensitive ion channel domain-containing protein [Dysgonamonadaceae bacterium]